MHRIVYCCYFLIVVVFLFLSTKSVPNLQLTSTDSSYCCFDERSEELFFLETVDQNNITKLITRLGNWGIARLLLHIKEMNHLGDRIRHIHPLPFLSYIYSQPELARCMKLINANYFKRKEFIAGLSEKMDMEANRNNLLPHVKIFSDKIGCIQRAQISLFLNRRDWEGLLMYLDQIQLEKEH